MGGTFLDALTVDKINAIFGPLNSAECRKGAAGI
ncbi:hypothetical protein PSAL_031030 [Pseudooceanicola algae]|uniref:Uncharacterized protein n=1 Tax=Pseudooceanicola algae TaxID=1537215 RepID=A0A418SJE7_9RHOB|nr:hypothetical protein PSAL_031030 [Pseudooceanicola algae]